MTRISNWKRLKEDQTFKNKLLIRGKVIDGIRSFFKSNGFLEVETPLLVKHPGTEPYLEVFETEIEVDGRKSQRAYLLTSPELQMKKLLAAGMGNIFQICKSFRNNEGISSFHNHEFTILEWYRVNANYEDIMNDTEQLLLHLNSAVVGSGEVDKISYQGREYDLQAPWERISVVEAFEQYAGVKIAELLSEKELIAIARKKGYSFEVNESWEQAYNQIFLNEIEPNLGRRGPTIIYDYPISQAALSRPKAEDNRFAERFEFYLAGLELGNAFSELTDFQVQRERMLADLAERAVLGKTKYQLDQDFIDALEMGIPETGGIAVGVDRLVMLFADIASMNESLLFPTKDLFSFSD